MAMTYTRPGDLVVGNDLTVGNDLVVQGTLTVTGTLMASGGIIFPSADPLVAGAWWDDDGTLTKSTGS